MAGVPAMTMAEIRLGMQDKSTGRHWSRGCWCQGAHQDGTMVVPPPWDESRNGERAR